MSQKDANGDAALLDVSPIDGRYRPRTRALERFFSEFALIRYRVRVEIEWYLSLAENPAIDALAPIASKTAARLRAIHADFSLPNARRVKELERTLNHDVKAVEYFVKERIAAIDSKLPLEMVHFACTSEDINSIAYALILKEFVSEELLPRLDKTAATLAAMAHRLRDVAMLSLTHGQAATPTTAGKEIAIFAARLERQLRQLKRQEYLGKASGAVGNFNAHQFACPEVDWMAHSRAFVQSLGLVWNPLTTQIESHDYMAELFDVVVRIDTILIDLARDMWGYISRHYFTQRPVAGEVGSSTMPHKVNPIDFENCEGNLGVGNALLQHLSVKLPISRFQRDLTDSTVLRGVGSAFGHVLIALAALERGLGLVEINRARITQELDDEQSWEVVSEAIQTLMRRYGLPNPYETLKELTRGRVISRQVIDEFVAQLPLSESVKQRLRALTPQNYLGLAAELVNRFTPGPKPD
ncbi:MAG TPA: adenylosuccinate lyase [Candidatus Binataceae bacterium]|nr:adenylosuccinate lyase [Candidatus Binataceae bacterium]